MGNLIADRLSLTAKGEDLNEWRDMVTRLKKPHQPVNICLVGKYVELEDSYYSVREALKHAALFHDRELKLTWIPAEQLEKMDDIDSCLRNAQGIVVPGGFGERGIEGMIKTARYARLNHIPYLGLCLGMQVMVIEFARDVFKSTSVNSTEFDPDPTYPVIDLMPDQKNIATKGHTMRLGNYPCKLVPGTLAHKAYQQDMVMIQERHRHRFEYNNDFRQSLQEKGLVLSGLSPDERLVEICEIKDNPWMVGCQFHPEFGSRPNRPHPLFRDFIGAAKDILREGAQPSLPLPN
jgi:CTP synthase